MSTDTPASRPEVMENLTESQLKELEFQASEYDEKQFRELAANYGWDDNTITDVWKWFETQNNYPIE